MLLGEKKDISSYDLCSPEYALIAKHLTKIPVGQAGWESFWLFKS